MAGAVLGVDFGTSNTAAVLHRDGRAVPLLFDGSPLLPSAVYLEPGAQLLVGRDAERAAGAAPASFEPNPKRRIDDGTVWLGEQEISVVDAVGAVLHRVATEAVRVAGGAADETVLTHPAGWGGPRMQVLAGAAARAQLPAVRFVPEPVAAAAYFTTVLGRPLPAGRCVVVYDLGGGTFDVAVVMRTGTGFEVLAANGLPDLGGLDLDAAVVAHVRAGTAQADEAWGRLDWPQSAADRRARQLLWQDARAAKEQLSRHPSAAIHVPLAEVDRHVTREEFEKLAHPILNRTVAITVETLRAARVGRESISDLFLVGGSSRVPLAAGMLHRALGIAPTVIEQPELVVAAGALHAARPAAAHPLPPPGAPLTRPASPAPLGTALPGMASPGSAQPRVASPGTAPPGVLPPGRPQPPIAPPVPLVGPPATESWPPAPTSVPQASTSAPPASTSAPPAPTSVPPAPTPGPPASASAPPFQAYAPRAYAAAPPGHPPVPPRPSPTARPAPGGRGAGLLRAVGWSALAVGVLGGLVRLAALIADIDGSSFESWIRENASPFVSTAADVVLAVLAWRFVRTGGARAWTGTGLLIGYALFGVGFAQYWFSRISSIFDDFNYLDILFVNDVLFIGLATLAAIAVAQQPPPDRRRRRPPAGWVAALVAAAATAVCGYLVAHSSVISWSLSGFVRPPGVSFVFMVVLAVAIPLYGVVGRPAALATGVLASWLTAVLPPVADLFAGLGDDSAEVTTGLAIFSAASVLVFVAAGRCLAADAAAGPAAGATSRG